MTFLCKGFNNSLWFGSTLNRKTFSGDSPSQCESWFLVQCSVCFCLFWHVLHLCFDFGSLSTPVLSLADYPIVFTCSMFSPELVCLFIYSLFFPTSCLPSVSCNVQIWALFLCGLFLVFCSCLYYTLWIWIILLGCCCLCIHPHSRLLQWFLDFPKTNT